MSHSSPVPTIFAASPRLSAIIAAIFSSTVPAQTNLRTCTERRCPIRNARSVAWSSTAGFHHRSTCTTWLAAVRVSPVPPAFSDRTNRGGPSSPWNRATSASRSALATPPCRNSHLAAEPGRQVGAQHPAELGVLGEQQRLLPGREHLLEDLLQPGQLARSVRPSRPPSCRNCAGWLQTCLSLVIVASTRPRRSMPSLDSMRASMSSTTAWYSDACSAVRLQSTSISSLSGRSLMMDLSVLSRRSTNGRVRRPQPGRGVVVAVPLDRLGVPLPERGGRAEQAGVGELHQRPQVGQPVLHRGTGDRDPVPGRQRPDGARLPGGGVLDGLRLVDDQPVPVDLGQRVGVAGGDRVRGEHQVATRPRPRRNASPAGAFGAVVHVDPQVGRERGGLPLPVADQRHRADQQRRARRRIGSPASSASSCTVLPRPMSSARIPPSPTRLEEVQPGQPALLVRPQRAPEAVGCGRRGEPPVGLRRTAARRASRRRVRPAPAGPPVRLVGGDRETQQVDDGQRAAPVGAQQLAGRRPAASGRARPTARAAGPAAC